MHLQIGDCRGLGGLVELLWHQLELKMGVYNAKVSIHFCPDCAWPSAQFTSEARLGCVFSLRSTPVKFAF